MHAFLRTQRRGRVMTALAASAATMIVLAACSSTGSGDGGEASGDTLHVGTILPQTGNLAFLGPPEYAGIGLAIDDLEAAGYEWDIERTDKDSGDTSTDVATQSAGELIDAGADFVVGAASSGVSMNVIDQFVDAGVVEISPANTSPDFTDYADDGYYWRTAPSDVIQGRVLGNLMTGDGAATVGFITINDPYGTGLEENATKAVEAAGGTVVASQTYNPGDTNFASQVSAVLAAQPDAVAILAFEETASIVPELIGTNGYPASQVYFVDGNLSNSYDFDDGLLDGAKGTLPGNPASDDFQERLLGIDDSLDDFSYAPESYDAVILAALAAAQGGSPDADTIRDNLQSVSEGGTKCETAKDCLALIADDEDIDYDGVSGPIEFDENGDPTSAYIGIYQYGADNTYSLLNTEFGEL